MGGGLGSGCVRQNPEQDKVLLNQDIQATQGDALTQQGFDLNDEPLVSSMKGVDIEKEEDSRECSEDGRLGNQKVGQLNENETEKVSVGDTEDNSEDDSVKQKVKEETAEGKVQLSGRVLRSRFAVKNGSEKEGDENGDSGGCEKKTIDLVKEEDDQSHGEAKGKPGRGPGVQCSDVDEKKADSVDRGQSNPSDGVNTCNIAKRKRGRPPKVQRNKPGRPPKVLGSDGSEKKEVKMEAGKSDHFDCNMLEQPKRKRGRPKKVQENGGFEKTTVKMEAGESDHSEGERSEESKCKRGRPTNVQWNEGFEKKAIEDTGAESYHSDGVATKEAKHENGRQAELQSNCGFEQAVKVVMGEGDQFDGEVREEVKRKRGRPPKVRGSETTNVQRNQGFEEKAVDDLEVKGAESYCSDGDAMKEAKHELGWQAGLHSNCGFEQAVKVVTGEGDQFDCELREEVKRKRGRPPKMQGCEGLERKKVQLGREGSDHNDAKAMKDVVRKRGRPRKLQVCSEALKGKLIGRRGRKKMSGNLKFNAPANTSCSGRRLIGKKLNAKGPVSVSANKVRNEYMESNDCKASQMLRPKVVNVKSKQKRVQNAEDTKLMDEGGLKRSEAKQLVRDRIVKMLIEAGWTIDYRPRTGRSYNDAVYVNPEGKTHWSVTLAYEKLKQNYESDECVSKAISNGFIFTPIPEEELSMLTRVVQKKRTGKKNSKGEHDDTVDDEVERKRNKRKKKWKGNGENKGVKRKKKQKLLKEKILLNEDDTSDGTLQKGTQVSGRKCKLQKTQKRKRYALLARNSMAGAESENGYVLYHGKRTVLSWMIDLGTVPQDAKVEYLIQRRTRATRESMSGKITRDGIRCNCCSDVFAVAEFETHAGSKLHRPFQNICLETGTPLLQCLLDSWNKNQSKYKGFHHVDFAGEDPNDDTCGICGDGGDLICCDSCPSTFHQSCLDIKSFPSGNWQCVYCTCKYCGVVRNTYQRDKDEDIDPAVLSCNFCEEKYHQPCIQTVNAFYDDSNGASFCGKNCKELFERLQMLVGVKHELPEGFSWTLLHRFDISPDVHLNEAYKKVESNSKLAVALSVMDECFLPLVDHRSGINLIHNIVYNFGSNFRRLNYSGFFTAILEKGDEITCAASIRIHGNQLAEMPFIGTRYTYRRQGMCRRLLSAVESALSSLNVEKLVIPAISELRETWISVFGFQPLETVSKQKMRNMSMLVFPGVDMLQKPLLMHVTEEQVVDEGSNKSGGQCSVAFDLNVSAEWPAPQTDKRNSAPPAVESTLMLPDGNLKDTSDLMVETVNLPESAMAPCITASGEQKLGFDSQLSIASEVKIDESIVKEILDHKHESSVVHSDDIGPAENEVALPVNVSKVDSQNAVTDNSDGRNMSEDGKDIKHHENSKFQAVEFVSDSDKTTIRTEDINDFHAIAKDVANQTSALALASAQDVANGHHDVSAGDTESRYCHRDKIGASKEVSAALDVNSHPCEICDDTAKKTHLQLCPGMS